MSNKPMKRTKAVSARSVFNEPGPRGSTDERRAPRGPGSGTIDEPIRPSPLIGKSFDGQTMLVQGSSEACHRRAR